MPNLDYLENSTFAAAKPFAEPAAIAQKPPAGPFYFRELAGMLPIGFDTIGENWSPFSPVRRDLDKSQVIEPGKSSVFGSAPTEGIYTGVGGYE